MFPCYLAWTKCRMGNHGVSLFLCDLSSISSSNVPSLNFTRGCPARVSMVLFSAFKFTLFTEVFSLFKRYISQIIHSYCLAYSGGLQWPGMTLLLADLVFGWRSPERVVYVFGAILHHAHRAFFNCTLIFTRWSNTFHFQFLWILGHVLWVMIQVALRYLCS